MDIIDYGLYATYILLLVAMLAALVFPLMYMIQNVNEAKKVFIGIAVLALILIIGYSTASADFYFKGIENFNISATGIKLVGAGLNTLYILIGVAILATLYFEIVKYIK